MRNGTRGPDNGKTQRNDKKLTSSGFKHQQICTPLPPTTKPPTKLLALTDPILALENLVKTLCNCYKNSKLSKTRSQKWNRLAAQKMNVKSPNPQQRRPVQETKNYNCVNSSTCKVGTRGGPANPDFNWTFRPQKWNPKRTCGISCLRSLAPRRFAIRTTQTTFTNPSLLRYSVLCSPQTPTPSLF